MAGDETILKAIGMVAALVVSIPAFAAVMALHRPTEAATRPVAPPAYALTLSADGARVDLEGRIDFGVTADLTALLKAVPGITTLRLQSPGGRVAEARGLVTVVKRFDLATVARGDCASACTLVFISGQNRKLDPGARLGFHGYDLRAPVFGMIDPAVEMARDSAVFRAAGVTGDFLDRAMAVPHRTMWFPDRGDLIAAGVIQGC